MLWLFHSFLQINSDAADAANHLGLHLNDKYMLLTFKTKPLKMYVVLFYPTPEKRAELGEIT